MEAAILVPLFVIPLLFGAMELGRVSWVRSQLMNAAREGGSFAQTSPLRVDSGAGCDQGRNIVARSTTGLRQGDELLAVQAGSVTVLVENVTTGVTLTGCFKPGEVASSGDRLLVTVSGNVSPYTLLGIIPVGGYTVAGSQEVRVQ